MQPGTIVRSIAFQVALAQLIGDIDFRILTYLEQQQQWKSTVSDTRSIISSMSHML